jgi:hypothetical protein
MPLLAELDGDGEGAHRGSSRRGRRRRKVREVEEEIEADLSWHHERAGELPAVRVDGDGFRDRTDEAPTTTTSAFARAEPDDGDFSGDFLDTERAAGSGRGSGVEETESKEKQRRERQSSLAFVEFLDQQQRAPARFLVRSERRTKQGFAPGDYEMERRGS